MYNRIYVHLDSGGLLHEKQFRFQKSNSTEYAILQLTRDITDSFEKTEYSLGVFIDLSNGLDTVDHQISIKKLPRRQILVPGTSRGCPPPTSPGRLYLTLFDHRGDVPN